MTLQARIRILSWPPAGELWEEVSAGTLPGHRPGYVAGLARGGIDPRLAVLETGAARVVFAFHIRALPGGLADIATLPGLSGLRTDGPPDQVSALLSDWADHAAAQGWVSGYLQLGHAACLDQASVPGQIRSHNAYFVFDLRAGPPRDRIGPNLRKDLRQLDRSGARLLTDRAALSRAFPDLYAASMARFGTAAEFAPDTLAAWLASPDAVLLGAGFGDGPAEIVGLCHRAGTEVEGHLIGATAAGRGLHAWLFCQMAEHFAGQGASRFNIGGFGRAGDGLHQLKSRLGADELPLRALRLIHDPEAFARLCRQTGADPDAAYFPPYRAPAVAEALRRQT